MTKESGKQQEQQMKDLMKLFENKINTEDFILEVESKPAIWDSRIEAYSNNIDKQNSHFPEYGLKSGVDSPNPSSATNTNGIGSVMSVNDPWSGGAKNQLHLILKTEKRKRCKNEDAEQIEVLKKKKDEDRHFLLSLLLEIRKVLAERKLKLRSDIISVIVQITNSGHLTAAPLGRTHFSIPHSILQVPPIHLPSFLSAYHLSKTIFTDFHVYKLYKICPIPNKPV
ncbi:hypothetical protein AVEN_243896-1 [Araneus ventricosus]|uniref:BESS domain-containing protein n=1 Tax=Araneus ventricosus TaxID=182803 RepID=A0A4Y2M9T3_ARAVE|nr:hypothetical protein AVEN_243896-1 [Araneus ventricosus]